MSKIIRIFQKKNFIGEYQFRFVKTIFHNFTFKKVLFLKWRRQKLMFVGLITSTENVQKHFNIIFVISGVIASFWRVFIEFRWHGQKRTGGSVIGNHQFANTSPNLPSDGLQVGNCKSGDSWLKCTGGCNSLNIGGQCSSGGNCRAGTKGGVEIRCTGEKITFNPKRCGGGVKMTHWLGERLSFLTWSCYGHKKSWLHP